MVIYIITVKYKQMLLLDTKPETDKLLLFNSTIMYPRYHSIFPSTSKL